jgi:deoxyribonuclease-4
MAPRVFPGQGLDRLRAVGIRTPPPSSLSSRNSMLLGAHVSTAGGIANAPVRAAEIDATAIQIFTKMPSRWAERPIEPEEADRFIGARREAGIRYASAHDSYLINLASPDAILRERSFVAFVAELKRARGLELDAVVTHPGNATDGDFERAVRSNASLVQRAIEEVGDGPLVLFETTAGSGQVLGARFEQLAMLRDHIAPPARDRIGFCFDTCHVFAAGYDLTGAYDWVLQEFDRIIGLRHLALFHLNDSRKPVGSRVDRHAEIGEGALGDEPFRRIMTDPRFASVPKVIETPKGDDPVTADRRNLGRLRSYR